MVNDILISDSELKPFLNNENDLAGKAKALLAQQKTSWEMLKTGYGSLEGVEVKTFDFVDFKIKVQFNPGRITSSSAKVDAKSIKERKCFLCMNNLPKEQRGILPSEGDYMLLCNPFPIFKEHFTIPNVKHVPQDIKVSFGKFLSFSRDLGRQYTVFYNGPKCGASAPDHLHFQAGNKYFMPIDSDYDNIKTSLGEIIIDRADLKVYAVDGYLAKFISIESERAERVQEVSEVFYNTFKSLSTSQEDEEPMMNILGTFESGKWRIILFPRLKHRPSYYFAEGEDNILLSPASVDMGGVLITPLEKDFRKIRLENILKIFGEITVSGDCFEKIKQSIVKEFTVV